MQRYPSQLVFRPSLAARKAAGSDLGKIARLALEAILKNGRSLEVAHQQIAFGKAHFVLSSRLGNRGQLILELDVGNAVLADRLILEDDLRRAERASDMVRSPKAGKRRF
jgi:hypothetical protein